MKQQVMTIAEIRKQNAKFSRMSQAQKRVAIALDVLQQIRAEQYLIQTGTWLTVNVEEESENITEAEKIQMQLLGLPVGASQSGAPTCDCCAIGAACASAIRLFNKHTLSTSWGSTPELEDYSSGKQILEYFEPAQLDMIEAAFEKRTDYDLHDSSTDEQIGKAISFGREYKDDTKRAEAIFKNIVKNKGTFKP